MLKHLAVHELFVASGADEPEQLDHFTDTFMHVSRNPSLAAQYAVSVLRQTMFAVEGGAPLVLALLAVVDNVVADLAREKM